MRLTRLSLTNFLGYEALDLDLDEPAYVIVGANGSGKSSLLDAIRWALYGEARIRDADKLIHDGASACIVQLAFEANGTSYTVIRERDRGKSTLLTLLVDGNEQTRHTIAETEGAIRGIVGLSEAALLAGPVMLQKESDAFMARRPADRKALLAEIAELERWATAADLVNTERKESDARLRDIGMERSALAQGILSEAETIATAVAETDRQLAVTQEAVSLATERGAQARAALATAKEKAEGFTREFERGARLNVSIARMVVEGGDIEEQLTAVRNALVAPTPAAYQPGANEVSTEQVTAAGMALGEGLLQRQGWDAAQTQIALAEQRNVELLRRAEIAKSVPCGAQGKFLACQFLIDVPSAEALAVSARAVDDTRRALPPMPDLQALKDEAERLQGAFVGAMKRRTDAEQAISLHVQKLAAADQRRADLTVQRKRHLDGMAAANEDLDQVKVTLRQMGNPTDLVVKCEVDLAEATVAYSANKVLLVQAEADSREAQRRSAVYADARGRDGLLGEEERTKAARVSVLRVIAEAFGRDGVPTMKLEEMLPQIESRANDALSRMPGQFSIRLVTEKALKGGGMADTLDVVVITSGVERDYGLLSVGQRFRVDLALRLGLAHVLASRRGARIETLWLDEPLADLDPEGRDAVVDTLAALQSEFGLTVVVSHDTSFNDRWGARVEVAMEDGVSTAVVIA